MRRYEIMHDQSLRFMSLSYDPEWVHNWDENPPVFATPAQFMGQMREKYFEDFDEMYKDEENDVYIPTNVLDEPQVKAGVDAAEQIFTDLANGAGGVRARDSFAGWDNARKGRLMILGTHGVLGAGSIYKALQDAPHLSAEDFANKRLDASLAKCRANGACKQDIDRAVTENIAERLMFRFITNRTPITRAELDSIIGAVLARAYSVEGRAIQKKRYKLLSDLLHFIGNQGGTAAVSDSMQKYIRENFQPVAINPNAMYQHPLQPVHSETETGTNPPKGQYQPPPMRLFHQGPSF